LKKMLDIMKKFDFLRRKFLKGSEQRLLKAFLKYFAGTEGFLCPVKFAKMEEILGYFDGDNNLDSSQALYMLDIIGSFDFDGDGKLNPDDSKCEMCMLMHFFRYFAGVAEEFHPTSIDAMVELIGYFGKDNKLSHNEAEKMLDIIYRFDFEGDPAYVRPYYKIPELVRFCKFFTGIDLYTDKFYSGKKLDNATIAKMEDIIGYFDKDGNNSGCKGLDKEEAGGMLKMFWLFDIKETEVLDEDMSDLAAAFFKYFAGTDGKLSTDAIDAMNRMVSELLWTPQTKDNLKQMKDKMKLFNCNSDGNLDDKELRAFLDAYKEAKDAAGPVVMGGPEAAKAHALIIAKIVVPTCKDPQQEPKATLSEQPVGFFSGPGVALG